MEACQSEYLLAVFTARHANCAFELTIICFFDLISAALHLRRLFVDRSGQLRHQVNLNRLLAVANEELVHVFVKLILIHIIYSQIQAKLIRDAWTSGNIIEVAHRWAHSIVILSNILGSALLTVLRQENIILSLDHHLGFSCCSRKLNLLFVENLTS